MSKKCTPLWRQAHFQVKMHKAPHCRTTFVSKPKCAKHTTSGPLLDVQPRHTTQQRQQQQQGQQQGQQQLLLLHQQQQQPQLLELQLQLQHWNHSNINHSCSFNYTAIQLQLQLQLYTTPLHYTTLHFTTLHHTSPRFTTTTLQLQLQLQLQRLLQLQLQLQHYNYNYINYSYNYTTTTTATATTNNTLHYTLHHTTSSSCGWGDHCNHSKKHKSNQLSVHQWICFAIHASQQLTSPKVSYLWNFRHRLVRYYWYSMEIDDKS